MRSLLLLLLLLAPGPAAAAPTEAEIDAVARELRCVVCQNLSVADSPSEMARQMRDLIRQRLTEGDTPAGVRAYFVSRYGEWVLLSPPARGFALIAWVLPLAVLVGGVGAALLVLRRWSRRGGGAGPVEEIDEQALSAVRRELERRTR